MANITGHAARLTRASIWLLVLLVFSACVYALWQDNKNILVDQTFPYGDGLKNNVPFPYPNWRAVIVDKVAIVVVLGAGLIAFLVPSPARSVRRFALVALSGFLYFNLRSAVMIYWLLNYQ